MKANLAYNAYSQNNVAVESSERLIEMLYEGVLRFSSLAKRAIKDNNIEKKAYWINRTIAIFTELLNSLDYNQGQVSYYLSGLYTHQIKLLTEANQNNDESNLDIVIKVTKSLLEAWRETTNVNNRVD